MDSMDVKAWDSRFRQVHGGREPHLVASVLVPHVGAHVQYRQRGIVVGALAVRESADQPLIVVWDEGVANPGASATNAMHALLAWAAAFWPLYPVSRAGVLQRDSDGAFDQVVASWTGDPPAPTRLAWHPVLAPQASPRTWTAVQAMWGIERAAEIQTLVRAEAER
jgi:hypothetical protein